MKKQLRQDLQKLFNKVGEISDRKSAILKEMQEMSADLGLPRYCSVQHCNKQLQKTKYEGRADYLLEQYQELSGQDDILHELGGILADNGFWKEDK